MELLLEFSDSEVARVEQLDGLLRVQFSAACVVRPAAPSRPRLQAYAQAVELLLLGVTATAAPAGLLGRVVDGRIAVAGRWAARLALPSRIDAPIKLELSFAHHGTLTVLGSGLVCRFVGDPNCSESLAC